MSITRRTFVRQGAAAGLGFTGLLTRFGGCGGSERYSNESKYGVIVPDPARVLNLPQGFRYRIISNQGDLMSDGLRVPGLPDGMAAFPGRGNRTILVRNHEINTAADPSIGPFGDGNELLSAQANSHAYDSGFGNPCLGGTTTVVVNTDTLEVEQQFLSLTGTVRNCAGGPTPGPAGSHARRQRPFPATDSRKTTDMLLMCEPVATVCCKRQFQSSRWVASTGRPSLWIPTLVLYTRLKTRMMACSIDTCRPTRLTCMQAVGNRHWR